MPFCYLKKKYILHQKFFVIYILGLETLFFLQIYLIFVQYYISGNKWQLSFLHCKIHILHLDKSVH